ncbi:MAG: hypothetical protein LBL98_06245 [Ruminococcus sp.]|jgi:hypothetical protein|nr:hypothetical protein [Ruminococcus sp.]
MTREIMKTKIDLMPDKAFEVLSAVFSPFFSYLIAEDNDDHFYSDANIAHIAKSIADYDNGEPLIVKTMEELEAYED